jgi:hypothetical protein
VARRPRTLRQQPATSNAAANGSSGSRPGARIFISYRRSAVLDNAIAHALRDRLEATGHSVFIDTAMRVGTNWAEKIYERIEWCDHFIVLLSPDAVVSEMVVGEVRRAHRRSQRDGAPALLPVWVGVVGDLGYELDAYLARLQYHACSGANEVESLLTEILRAIETQSTASPSPPRRPLPSPVSLGSQRPSPFADARREPGGTVPGNDPLYIRRHQDILAEQAATRIGGETLLIRAPRQWGKSSLAVRYRDACRRHGKAWSYIDLQFLPDDAVAAYPSFLTEIARQVVDDLELTALPDDVPSFSDLTRFMERQVLPQLSSGLVLIFDEADRIISLPYKRNFFAMLRGWHNRRAVRPDPWERLDIAVVIATEPWLLIDDPNESPFNVATPLELTPLTIEHVAELGARQGINLSQWDAEQLWMLLRGQPYLTRMAFYRLSTTPELTLARLEETAADTEGPFGEHLRSLLVRLQRRPELRLIEAMHQAERHGSVPSEETFQRLTAAGLVRHDAGRVVPANLLYGRFFRTIA